MYVDSLAIREMAGRMASRKRACMAHSTRLQALFLKYIVDPIKPVNVDSSSHRASDISHQLAVIVLRAFRNTKGNPQKSFVNLFYLSYLF